MNNSPIDIWTIIYIFGIIVIILIVHMIFRLFRLLAKKQERNKPIEPKITVRKIPTPKFNLMVGGTYLVLEKNEKETGQCFKIFMEILHTGSPGLLVTRMYPEKVKKKYGIKKVLILWLSRSKNKNSIRPTNLGTIVEEISEFISKRENVIIMLDGLEYLSVHNDFQRVLKFLHSLKDEVTVHNARLIISLNPKTFAEKKIALLKKEFRVLNHKNTQ